MVDPNELIPILGSIHIFGFVSQPAIQSQICPSTFEPFLANMRKHLSIHLDLVYLTRATCIRLTNLVDIFFSDVAVVQDCCLEPGVQHCSFYHYSVSDYLIIIYNWSFCNWAYGLAIPTFN